MKKSILFLLALAISGVSIAKLAVNDANHTVKTDDIEWNQAAYKSLVEARTQEGNNLSLFGAGGFSTSQGDLPTVIQRGNQSIWLFDQITLSEFNSIATVLGEKSNCSESRPNNVPVVICAFTKG